MNSNRGMSETVPVRGDREVTYELTLREGRVLSYDNDIVNESAYGGLAHAR